MSNEHENQASNENPVDEQKETVQQNTPSTTSGELDFIDEAPMVNETKEVAVEATGPVVDPTGTFSDWPKFDESGFSSVGYGEDRSSYIPLPKTDEESYKILQPNPQVQLRRAVYGTTPARTDLLPMYNFVGTEVEFFNALVHYDIHGQRRKQEYSDEHSEVIDNCVGTMVPDSYLWKAQWRPGAVWTNQPNLGGKDLHMGPSRDKGLVGSIQNSVGDHRLGVNNMTPMWHSGFHTRIRTPTGRQFAELDALIASDKNIFGRRTGGAMFTNVRCYLESAVLDLFIDCLETTNIANWTPEIVRRLLDGRDIQLCALALQAARYPTKYPAIEPCVESEAGCRNVKHTSFTPMNSLIVDEARFTPSEIRFMNERFVTRTETDIIQFQKDASWNQMKTIDITPTLQVRIKHPKATEVIDSGYVWAGSISAAVARVLGDDSPSRNRANFIGNLIESESLRRYTAYFDGIIEDGVEGSLDEFRLNQLLEYIGDDQQIIRKFEIDVRDYEEQDIIAFMGTPRYLCLDCEKRLSTKDPDRLEAYNKNPIIVPQDAVSRFFMSRRR